MCTQRSMQYQQSLDVDDSKLSMSRIPTQTTGRFLQPTTAVAAERCVHTMDSQPQTSTGVVEEDHVSRTGRLLQICDAIVDISCGTIDAVVRMTAGYAATVRLTLGPLQLPPPFVLSQRRGIPIIMTNTLCDTLTLIEYGCRHDRQSSYPNW